MRPWQLRLCYSMVMTTQRKPNDSKAVMTRTFPQNRPIRNPPRMRRTSHRIRLVVPQWLWFVRSECEMCVCRKIVKMKRTVEIQKSFKAYRVSPWKIQESQSIPFLLEGFESDEKFRMFIRIWQTVYGTRRVISGKGCRVSFTPHLCWKIFRFLLVFTILQLNIGSLLYSEIHSMRRFFSIVTFYALRFNSLSLESVSNNDWIIQNTKWNVQWCFENVWKISTLSLSLSINSYVFTILKLSWISPVHTQWNSQYIYETDDCFSILTFYALRFNSLSRTCIK